MKFKIPYTCVIYSDGDVVFPKYPDADSIPRKIVSTRLDILGTDTVTQFLKFEGQNSDLNVSNHFVPYGDETREKYKDGLLFYQGVNKAGDVITTSTTKVIPIDKKKIAINVKQEEITFNPYKPPNKEKEYDE